MSLYSFESASGTETIGEIGVSLGASDEGKGTLKGTAVNGSIVDRNSEIQNEDIVKCDSRITISNLNQWRKNLTKSEMRSARWKRVQ
jgi:hypothetical protein